jgi:hypothetical protein
VAALRQTKQLRLAFKISLENTRYSLLANKAKSSFTCDNPDLVRSENVHVQKGRCSNLRVEHYKALRS